MLFNFNEAWPRVVQSEYNVCVCRTGPAGITLARKLAAHGKRVLLLEAGELSGSNLKIIDRFGNRTRAKQLREFDRRR